LFWPPDWQPKKINRGQDPDFKARRMGTSFAFGRSKPQNG
jgi:hypothetical protein